MPTVADVFSQALQHHQAGNLELAEQLYRQILASDPNHAESHHLLGVLAYQQGRPAAAVISIRDALKLNPGAPIYHANLGVAQNAMGQPEVALASFREALRLDPQSAQAHLAVGNALRVLGRLEEAVDYYAAALRLQPDFVPAHNNRGSALFLLGRLDEAVAHYERAVILQPNSAEAHCNLGNALHSQGKLEPAVAHCHQAVRLRADYPEGQNNLGNALCSLGKWEEAIPHCRQAIRLLPNFPEAHNNLGNALAQIGDVEEAVAAFREALRLRPDFAQGWSNLGNALTLQSKLDEAVVCFEKALQLKADYAEAYANLGTARAQQGEFDAAQDAYARALRLDTGHAPAHRNQALLWLLRGRWPAAWQEYEWRWQTSDFPRQSFTQPRWDGAPLAGRTLLLVAEQGLGDTMQFLRYLPLVKQRGGRVVLQCQPQLARLLKNVPIVEQVVAQVEPLPPFDCHLPLLSLPWIFRTRVDTVPADIPYLYADSQLVVRWRRELAPKPSFKVGIAWQGNPTYQTDRQRSIPLKCFSALADLEGIQLISLQKGPGLEQLDSCQLSANSYQPKQLDEDNGPFMDTAAVIMNLDLVICSDTAVAHLAGTLGTPVWLALPFVPDWRWLLERPDTPWYPSMRLFRQKRYGNWEHVFDQTAAELSYYLQSIRIAASE